MQTGSRRRPTGGGGTRTNPATTEARKAGVEWAEIARMVEDEPDPEGFLRDYLTERFGRPPSPESVEFFRLFLGRMRASANRGRDFWQVLELTRRTARGARRHEGAAVVALASFVVAASRARRAGGAA